MKKHLCIALISVLVLLQFSGCASKDTKTTTSSQAGISTTASSMKSEGTSLEKGSKIKMWTFLDPYGGTSGREKVMKTLMDSFKEKYDVEVTVETHEWQTMTAKFFAAHSAGTAPDVMWVVITELGTAIKMGALEKFENLFMKDWDEKMLSSVQGPSWDYCATKDAHYQMHFSKNITGIMYRSDLLEEAGYSVPFKNWDELRKAAIDLTVEKDKLTGTKRYGFGLSLTASNAEVLPIHNILATDMGLFNEDGTAHWATNAGVSAIQMVSDMIHKDGSVPESAITTSPDEREKNFASGMYAMMNAGNARIESIQKQATFDPTTIRFTTYPSFKDNIPSKSLMGGWCVSVWSGSKHKQEAGKFVEWMLLPENDKLWVEIGGSLPMVSTTLELAADYLKNPEKLGVVDSYNASKATGYFLPSTFATTGWANDLAQAHQDVLVNNVEPMEALLKAEKSFNSRHKR